MFNLVDQLPLYLQLATGLVGSFIATRHLTSVLGHAKCVYSVAWIILTVMFLSLVIFTILGQAVPVTIYHVTLLTLVYITLNGRVTKKKPIPARQRKIWTNRERAITGGLLLAAVPTTIIANDLLFVVPEMPVRITSFKLLTPEVNVGEDAIVEIKGVKAREDCVTEVRNTWFDRKTTMLIAEISYTSGFLSMGEFSAKIKRPTVGVDSRNISYAISPGDAYMRTRIDFHCKEKKHTYWSPLLTVSIKG